MENFILAVVSLIIAVSLLISKKKESLHFAFAFLLLVIFVYKGAALLHATFVSELWKSIEYVGLISVPPFLINFTRHLILDPHSILTRKLFVLSIFFSLLVAVFIFSPLRVWLDIETLLYIYTGVVIILCYLALFIYTKKKVGGGYKTRFTYLIVACGAVGILSTLDLLYHYGYAFAPVSSLLIAALVYLVFIMITHPKLPELHELMSRALVVAVITFFATATLAFITGLFGKGPMPTFTNMLLASFVIVISIEPLKLVLKRILSYFYPESKDVFTSLYAFDERLEKEKSILLEEMASVLAHEIRNPLGSIKGAAQYLRSETNVAENQKLLDVIIEEVDRLNRVVSQFLNYAKPYTPNLKIADVNQIIDKAIMLIKTNNIADHILIEKDLRSDLPPVKVDTEQLLQVILNIAINAIESMEKSGTLTFRTSKIEGYPEEAVGISIRDTGRGIKKEEMKNIFKPFFTTKERGAGLGLAICHRIIKNHGGNLRVKSIPGQGSIFYIRLNAS